MGWGSPWVAIICRSPHQNLYLGISFLFTSFAIISKVKYELIVTLFAIMSKVKYKMIVTLFAIISKVKFKMIVTLFAIILNAKYELVDTLLLIILNIIHNLIVSLLRNLYIFLYYYHLTTKQWYRILPVPMVLLLLYFA